MLKNKKNNRYESYDFKVKSIVSIEKALKKHIFYLVNKDVEKLKKK